MPYGYIWNLKQLIFNHLTIVIPMAGLSQRFIKAGFTLPKYMLYIKDKTLFNLAVCSFEKYFSNCDFIFIARNLFETKRFIESECRLLGISNFQIITLENPTRGQAETIYLGLNKASLKEEEPILIFNIDTFRPKFCFPENILEWDGYLEVFFGEGANWSYAKTESTNSTKVIQTAEKNQISNYCSTGLYYFKSVQLFKSAYEKEVEILKNDSTKELYVAPLYNILIEEGNNIHIHLIKKDEVQFCGIPEEYYAYLNQKINEK